MSDETRENVVTYDGRRITYRQWLVERINGMGQAIGVLRAEQKRMQAELREMEPSVLCVCGHHEGDHAPASYAYGESLDDACGLCSCDRYRRTP